ncbi:hypothetical protein Dimus_023436 [Dionaea muscipula]
MGSSTSRLSSQPAGTKSKRAAANVAKRSLSSLICGSGSCYRAGSAPEDYPAETLVNSAECCGPVVSKFQDPRKESILPSVGGTAFTSSETEHGVSSGSSGPSSEESFEQRYSIDDPSFNRKCISEINESVSSHGTNAESNCYPRTLGDAASTSLERPSIDVGSDICAIDVGEDNLPRAADGVVSESSWIHQAEGSIQSQGVGGLRDIPSSDSDPYAYFLNPGTGSPSIDDDNIPSGLAGLISDPAQHLSEGDSLHLNTVSASSGNLSGGNEESSAREARHSRRMFWDAFSNRSSRRRSDFSTILLASEDTDSMGSRRRWLIDFGGDLIGGGNSSYSAQLYRRSHIGSERWWRSRSQLLDRMRGGTVGSGLQTTCPLGLHPDDTCSCELDEETGTRASISRIVMLAEALFEVLDEIHRQPSSVSLPTISPPAPESIVDAFPLRTFNKSNSIKSEEDAQCYICLAEYADGDEIRILPCHHEYHMLCVDKWLKKIHGVCPLCRGDVCERSGFVTNSDVSPRPLDDHP